MKSFSQSPRDFVLRQPRSHSQKEAAQDLHRLPLLQAPCSSRSIGALRGQGGVGSQEEAPHVYGPIQSEAFLL